MKLFRFNEAYEQCIEVPGNWVYDVRTNISDEKMRKNKRDGGEG